MYTAPTPVPMGPPPQQQQQQQQQPSSFVGAPGAPPLSQQHRPSVPAAYPIQVQQTQPMMIPPTVNLAPPMHAPSLVHPIPTRPANFYATPSIDPNLSAKPTPKPPAYTYQPVAPAPYPSQNTYQPSPVPSANPMYASPYGPPTNNANDAFSSLMNDPRAQIGMQLGSKAFQAGHEYMNENIHRYINVPHMKYYFNVSRGYVFKKIRTLLFPFRQAHWYRLARRNESGQSEYRPPREDLHAPDLYIPTMGFVTYVFLVNLESGFRTGFHPELLGVTSSKAFFAILCEVLLVKLGCYLFSIQATVPILDLVAYAGYKFVGIIVILLVHFPVLFAWIPHWMFWATLAYTSLALGFFSLRSMRYIVVPEPGTTTAHVPQRRRRINFLAAVVGLQILSSWLLVK